jgi:hypothetical protein
MAMDAASKNRAACRSWYERLKNDTVKYRARIDRISENRLKRKARASQALAQSVKQAATDQHPRGPCVGQLHSPHIAFEAGLCEAGPCEAGRFEAPGHPPLLPSCEPHVERAFGALEEFLMDAAAENLDEEIGYGERAAIKEFDGGLTRAAADLAAAVSSTCAARPASPTGTSGGFKAPPPSGGKHAATIARENDGLTADRIIKMWRNHWGIASQTS